MNRFFPLASGSKGNCIYLETNQTRILVDAGISLAAIKKRLAEFSILMETIQAILITHEHIDHIRGLAAITSKYRIPILANVGTAKKITETLQTHPHFKIFTTGESFCFKDLEISPFTIPHDTVDPVAFVVQTRDKKLGICTDLGHVTSTVRKMLEGCNYLYLESNHQPSMVHASARPTIYKERVLGKQGHLSNEQCADLLASVAHDGLEHVHLAHLSSECNSEKVAMHVVGSLLESEGICVPISIAYQSKNSRVIEWGSHLPLQMQGTFL